MTRIHYLPDNKDVDSNAGETILQTSQRCGITHTHACGGHARCSTCRVLVVEGLESCAPRNEKEQAMAERLHFTPEIRLACQTTLSGAVKIRRLAIDAEDVELIKHETAAPAASIGVEKRIGILFSDIRGFTPFSEALPPYDVVHILNRYFDVMGKVVQRNGGCIDNYMGDGLMALFGVDRPENAALNAVTAGLEMLKAMDDFKPYLQTLYGKAFDIGVGVHVGEAVVGDIGASNKKRTTAIGDAVNFASRIESANKKAQTRLLISADTFAEVKDRVEARAPIPLTVAGKTGIYNLHEVLSLKSK